MKLFLFFSLLIATVFADLVCPPGFQLVLNKCLRVIQNPLTHTQAEADCTYLGGTLVNVHSAIENRAVSDFASKSGANKTWIGLFCFANQNSSSCYYDDNFGTASIYNNFGSGYPRIDDIYGGCVYMSTEGSSAGKWISVKCEAESMPFVCEVPSSSYDPSCTHNYDGYCYIPSTELSTVFATFSDAQSVCQQLNGNLASIHSKRENDYIVSLFRNGGNSILLGAVDPLPNTFSWADGTNFAGFDYRDPLDTRSGDCLAMDPNSGLWSRVSSTSQFNFICKRPISAIPTAPSELATTVNPSDFSNCNTTFLMAPGVITSYDYLDTTASTKYCSWQIVTLGAYRIRLSFTDINVDNYVNVYDDYGNRIGSTSYMTSVISPRNMINVTFQASGRAGYRGFRAVAQPY